MSAALAAPVQVRPQSAFERHGITHVSPSSLNLFAAQPAMFVMEKLLKRRGSVGCAAHRGTATEAGIVHGLLHPHETVECCQAVALASFDGLSALSGDPRKAKERDAVPAIVATALPILRRAGVPDEIQKKVVVEVPELPVPLLGFLDVGWTNLGLRIDLKSQLAVSSTMKDSHARQLSLYLHGTNYVGKIAYVGPSKVNAIQLENPAEHFQALIHIAQRLERFLSVSDDPQVLAGIVVPDWEAFWWNDPATRALGREVFGF